MVIIDATEFQKHKHRAYHSWQLVFRNPADFTLDFTRFHPWNPADFTQISPVKSTQNYKSKCFSKNSSVWWMQGGGFHPWNLADFTLEIQWISARFHLWNPPKIIKASVSAKTLQFDECRVGDFTLEIWQISPWNLVDFTHEIQWISARFHLWNPPKIIKASVSAKTLQFDECRLGAMTKDFMKSTRFHPEIWWISPRFHLWNPSKIIKASVSAKALQFDECRVDAGWGLWPRISWNLLDFMWNPHEIRRISKLWAFAWWSSIGLSFFERPTRKTRLVLPSIAIEKQMILLPLADLGGVSGARTPKGPDSLVSTYKFFET